MMHFKFLPPGMPVRKRLFDLMLTIPGLLVIGPMLLILSFWIKRKMGSPIFFKQVRPGYRNEPFSILKFRTMNEDFDAEGYLLADESRLTALGKALRALSIDELPELLNVLLGEMSLVGPRPLLMKYLELYSKGQARRHDVLPGMTGWAQVNGRNALTWEDKFEFDVWYVDHWSLWLDVKILMLTALVVLRRRGISQPGSISAEEFRGSRDDG